MSKNKKQPSPEQIRLEYLNRVQLSAFDSYMNATHPEGGTQDIPEEELDKLFQVFQIGFNSGIYHAAGETLMLLGINLATMKPVPTENEEEANEENEQ